LTEQNYTLTYALGLTHLRAPTLSYYAMWERFAPLHELSLGIVAIIFKILFDLWTMLNSEHVYAKADQFGHKWSDRLRGRYLKTADSSSSRP
jgi:hypothetical protein